MYGNRESGVFLAGLVRFKISILEISQCRDVRDHITP